MEYRIANKQDLSQLAKMRWDFKTEGNENTPSKRSEFLKQCINFLEKGMEQNQ